MTKHLTSIVIGSIVGAALLYQLYRDYVHSVGIGRPLGWFALECLLLAVVAATILLLWRGAKPVAFEAITGVRAIVAACLVLAMIAPAFLVGFLLDEVFGPHLSATVLMACLMMNVATRVIGALASRYPAVQFSRVGSDEIAESAGTSPPPN